MISVCCCSINCRFDIDNLIRLLQHQNRDVAFEVVVAHDDRMNDGSGEHFRKLSEEFSNVKIVTHSEEDTLDYFEACLAYYRRKGIFTPALQDVFEGNLIKYKEGVLVDKSKGYLWQSSGILYNKAVLASRGDIVIVTPGDFVYLFPLKEIELFVKSHARNGLFYASLPALWARVTNMDRGWLEHHIQDILEGRNHRLGWRWDSVEIFRDFLRFSPDILNTCVPDFQKGRLIFFKEEECADLLAEFCTRAAHNRLHQFNQAFHGFHVMTRKAFDAVGGFTEEWFHRAFPDDKMTALGARLCGYDLPPKFSVAWCGQHELLPGHGPGYEESHGKDWEKKLPIVDSWFDKHPIPPRVNRTYLYSPGYTVSHMDTYFSRLGPPVRIRT